MVLLGRLGLWLRVRLSCLMSGDEENFVRQARMCGVSVPFESTV